MKKISALRVLGAVVLAEWLKVMEEVVKEKEEEQEGFQ